MTHTPESSPYPFHLPPWLILLLASLLGLAVAWTIRQNDPESVSWLPPCLFHRWTGLHCPGCGNTRALHALMHGEILRSLGYNPLLLPYLGLAALLILKPRLCCCSRLTAAVLIVILAFFILRNIPCFPFTLLAP